MKVKNVYVFRVPEGRDLVRWIEDFGRENEIRRASVFVIGALKSATIGYFDESQGKYLKTSIDEQCELLSGMGNISWKEGKEVFLHLHVVLGRRDFSTIGGHLMDGEVFVAEVIIHEYDGRCPRVKTGNLYLWRA